MDFMALLKEERLKCRLKNDENKSRPPPPPPPPPPTLMTLDFDSSFCFTSRRSPIDLKARAVGPVETISYVPCFVSRCEARSIVSMVCMQLFRLLLSALDWQSKRLSEMQVEAVPANHPRWVRLSGRSLQCWGGQPPPPACAARSSQDAINDREHPTEEALPAWLEQICEVFLSPV